MTREEAIAILEKEVSIINDNSIEMTVREWDEFDDLKRDAIPVAIEALSVDVVSIHEDGTLEVKVPNAQKVGRVLVMDTDSHIGGGLFYPELADVEWIPCSDRLPSKSGQYLVFYEGAAIGSHIDIMWYGEPLMPNVDVSGKHFYRSDVEWGDIIYDEVVAWMPLPKPYKGGDSE